MIGIIFITILIILLYVIVSNKNNKQNNFQQKNKKIKLLTREDECERDKKERKQLKTYIYPMPQYYDFKDEDYETPEDKFIFEYVYQNRLFKDNKGQDPTRIELGNYRDKLFDFRNSTNIDTNMITPVDNINEMMLTNPDLQGKSIGDIYDSLTSNKVNALNYNL
jgi:hypothetical protein